MTGHVVCALAGANVGLAAGILVKGNAGWVICMLTGLSILASQLVTVGF